MDTKKLNFIEKWAGRDEEGPYRDLVVLGDVEPTLFMGRWDWRENRNFWSIGPNVGNVCINPGEKKKVKVFIVEENEG